MSGEAGLTDQKLINSRDNYFHVVTIWPATRSGPAIG